MCAVDEKALMKKCNGLASKSEGRNQHKLRIIDCTSLEQCPSSTQRLELKCGASLFAVPTFSTSLLNQSLSKMLDRCAAPAV